MSADNTMAHDTDAPIFAALLTPHRSLGRSGFLIVMLLFGGVSFVAGMAFLLMGAWPVFGFFGLDVLLLYLAFQINYRTAAAYEEVTVTATELKVRKVTHHGRVREWTLNPLWVRLETVTHEDYGMEKLLLVTRGRALPIATLLGPNEKASFAKALATAIGEAKRGPTRTVLP
jgi:uncharacterized membrane protein